jgi:single-stranded DNA-binding protein
MDTPIAGLNTAIVAGTLSSDPRELVLSSGSRLVRLEVTTRDGTDQPADTVPVAWFDPPVRAPALQRGDAVVVVGKVRRRYFGSAAGPRSATEVVATIVVPERRRAAVRRAVAGAVDGLRGWSER